VSNPEFPELKKIKISNNYYFDILIFFVSEASKSVSEASRPPAGARISRARRALKF
jgi:hypothetical protein